MADSFLIPDILTPAQYFGSLRIDSSVVPVKRLMLAVLEDAIRCFQSAGAAIDNSPKQLVDEAERWLFSEEDDGPFAFVTICEILGIEPSFMRAGLQRWRDRQLPAMPSGVLCGGQQC